MHNLLHSQLCNTQTIHDTLLREGRQDGIANIVLSRMQAEINTYKRLLRDKKNRQEMPKYRFTRRIIRLLRQAMYRRWNFENRSTMSIHSILESVALSKKAVAR